VSKDATSEKYIPVPPTPETTLTIAERVLQCFFDELSNQPEMAGIAARLKSAANNSETALRTVIFGEDVPSCGNRA
jgi:hypothetical protein